MTRFEPTLLVRRLVIDRNDRPVYDEILHEGVNVIRGENSSGKSTILNLIFYGLGGDLADWSPIALLCSRVTLEIAANGHPATISRVISQQTGQPMEIFGGGYEDAQRAPRSEWIRYPYRRSESRESFSQALFRLLGIPEVRSETQSITIHQLLRLLYADQLSPVDDIFRVEQFDPPVLRDAIGRLLCGAYDSKLYENELEVRALVKDFEGVSAELRSLSSLVGKTGQALTMDWITGEKRVLETERVALQKQIEAAERGVYTNAENDKITLLAQQETYERVQQLQQELVTLRTKRDATTLTIADSASFIASLERKLAALEDASNTAQHFSEIRFGICPACYATLPESQTDAHACHLCKTPFDSGKTNKRIVALINEAALQVKQSRMLQAKRQQEIAQLDGEIGKTQSEWQRAGERLSSIQLLPSTEARNTLRELHRQAGYLQRKFENLDETMRIVELVDQLSVRKHQLNDRINVLRHEIELLKAAQSERLKVAYSAIADETRTLLHNDLPREQAFNAAENIQFNFSTNSIRVDGQSYFSASSRVILKSSFFLGFFAAATKLPFFRHPRFVMIDTIEDKGMEPARSHNFQMQVLRVSRESRVEHQIIFATSMIAPDLEDKAYTIGKFSTHDDRTLKIES